MPAAKSIPQHILDDDGLVRRFKVDLAEALSLRMDESEWKKFSTRHGLSHLIDEHPRFLRAAHWQDNDFEGLVLDLVNDLFSQNKSLLVELFQRDGVQRWFKDKDSEFLEIWEGTNDPLLEALGYALEEVQGLSSTVDLREHSRRIRDALPGDPSLAIGTTKDMLEATMRTILHERGVTGMEKWDYPTLSTKCFHELGLTTNTPPASDDERYVRKIASSAKAMVDAANELRNVAGTGHGRVVGTEPEVSAHDAGLVASTGFILAAWMLRHSQGH
ncbi:abortive infection family protein [Roseomonas sp. 18066]|uniref:abortive infection family protein n=1 Tax=Roseomonas sp. 18066 TaxID=2681412 RepID=UPI002105EF14|nr:abortive infection family protein [Roseomonas sp. 18066]